MRRLRAAPSEHSTRHCACLKSSCWSHHDPGAFEGISIVVGPQGPRGVYRLEVALWGGHSVGGYNSGGCSLGGYSGLYQAGKKLKAGILGILGGPGGLQSFGLQCGRLHFGRLWSRGILSGEVQPGGLDPGGLQSAWGATVWGAPAWLWGAHRALTCGTHHH